MTTAGQARPNLIGAEASVRPSLALVLAVWLAFVTGLIEAGVRAFELYALGRFIRVGPHVVWMAPVANLFWFGVPALLLFFAARKWPQRVSIGLIVGTLSFISFLSLVLLYPKMHKAAAVVLALGLAVQASRILSRHQVSFDRTIRRTLRWVVVAVAGSALAVVTWRAVRERRIIAQLPTASASAPNVLLLVLDTVRSMSMSLYGYERPTTPELERWAKLGVRFDRAFSTAPWTLPSHASMFTGRYPNELSAGLKAPLDDTYPTLAEVLASRGYVTGGFAANTQYTTYEQGLDRGFSHYEDHRVAFGSLMTSCVLGRQIIQRAETRRLFRWYERPGRKVAAQVNADFLHWAQRRGNRPFFAFLNYFDAHDPYRPPAPFDTAFGADPTRGWGDIEQMSFEQISPASLRAEQNAYDAGILYIDHEIGRLLEELKRRGWLDNTVIIITSDHGEHWGEHELIFHANSLYRHLLQVPLVMIYPPRLPAGLVVSQSVSLRDLPATVFDLVGMRHDERFPGTSLAEYWTEGAGTPRANRTIFASNLNRSDNWLYSLMEGGWHYIKMPKGQRAPKGREELYDFERDPLDSTDLANTPEGALAVARFRMALDTFVNRPTTQHQRTAAR